MTEQAPISLQLQAQPTPAAMQNQNNASPVNQNAGGNQPSEFSQALQSANGRMNPPASHEASGSKNAAASEKESDDSDTSESADPASNPQMLLALQSMLANQANNLPAQIQNVQANTQDAAADNSLALAMGQAKTIMQATSANIAAAAANNKDATASTSASLEANPQPDLAQGVVQKDSFKSTLEAFSKGDDSKDLSSFLNGNKALIEKEVAALQGEGLKDKAAAKDATQQGTGSFANDLSNAQLAMGVKNNPLNDAGSTQSITQHTVQTPVNAHNWVDELGQKINWVANKDNGRAELILNPPHMGKIEVSINLNGDQASASFTAANPSTREALQDAMPRLKEVLADAGIQLGQANVSAGNSGQTQSDQQAAQSHRQSQRWLSGGQLESVPLTAAGSGPLGRTSHGNGLVDLFA